MSDSKKKVLTLAVISVMVLALLLGVVLALPSGDLTSVATAAEGDTVIKIAESSVVHWVVKDANSDLRDGKIYRYTYKADGKLSEYYSVVKMSQAPDSSWTDWALDFTYEVKISVMRYRGEGSTFNHEVALYGALLGTGFEVEFINDVSTGGHFTTKADKPGRYQAKAKFTAKEGYTFSDNENERATLSERGIELEVDPDGKTATMTKWWYLANYDNALLNGQESIDTGTEVEFKIPSWKFGEYVDITYPWLYHGDGALRKDMDLNDDYSVKVKDTDGDYVEIIESITTEGRARTVDLKPAWDPRNLASQSKDIVTFSLTRTVNGVKEVITQNNWRSRWGQYFNRFMPEGDYELEIVVKDIILSTHKHWWDNSEHFIEAVSDDVESEYKGFTRTFNFSVLPGNLTITNDDVLNQSGRVDSVKRQIDLETINADNYKDVFKQSEELLQFEYSLKYADIVANENLTFWTSNISKYFDKEPHLEYNLYRMKGDDYYKADSTVWARYITTPSTYTVYYMAKMKNYASNPSMENRYDNYYEVIVYQHIDVPTLNRDELVYTGGELSVQPKDKDLISDRDMSLYTWSNNTKVEVGEYTVKFELSDKVHYKWRGNKAYDFGEDYTLDWKIKPAVVDVPVIADRDYKADGFVKPSISIPKNQVLNKDIFEVTYPNGNGEFKDAGTYDITLTLSDENYIWATGDADKDGVITVPFKINPETNIWKVTPRITQWEWNGFNKTINIIESESLRGVPHYCISYDADGRRPVAGLDDFTILGGALDQTVANNLFKLNSGSYYLTAKVEKAKNWTELSSEPLKFDVAVARNYWESSPNIIRWKYDGYEANVNLITAVPHFGDKVEFSIISKKGATAADDVIVIDNMVINERGEAQGLTADSLSKLEGGKTYWLKAVVERKPADYIGGDVNNPVYNYTEMVQYIEFHIQTANNYWEQTPNIERWVAGETPYVPSGLPKWGEAVFVVYNDRTNEVVFNSKQNINKLDQAKPGWYRIEASVEGNNNYTGLTSVTKFKVFDAQSNFWNVVPNIQSWTEGASPNAPVAEAAFGNITYSYYFKSDYEANGLEAQKLDNVPTVAGDYVMVAVAESDEHNDLIAAVNFSIYKTAIKETVYIGLVAAMGAIILIGAAVVAAVIVRMKKNGLKLATANSAEFAEVDAEQDDSDTDEDEEELEADVVADVEDEMDDTPALDPTSID